MAVENTALTTRANLKLAVGIAAGDTSKDAYLDSLIDRASWLIEDMTGRKFTHDTMGGFKARKYNGASGTLTLGGSDTTTSEDYIYFDGTEKRFGGHTIVNPDTGLGEFHLPAYPVQANSVLTFVLACLSSRSSSGGEVWDTTTHVENESYIVDRNNGILRLLGGQFVPGTKNYRVTMAAGYIYGSAQPYVPPDLEMLCIEMAKQLYRDNRAVTSESLGTWSRSYNAELLKEDPFVQKTLAKYTRFAL